MAQRFYIPRRDSPTGLVVPITPTPDADWDRIGTLTRLKASTTKAGDGSSGNHDDVGNGTNPNDVANIQVIAGPFTATTISGYWKSAIRSRAFAATTDARAQLVVRCLDIAGTSELARLIEFNTGALASEFPNGTAESRRFPLGSPDTGTPISATISEPFYIVAEYGARIHSTDTTNVIRQVTNDSVGLDVDYTEGSAGAGDSWFELENALTFTTPVTPTTASLTLATFAPTVTVAAGSQTVTPTTASLVLTAFAPTVNVGTTVRPSTASLTLTTFAPTVASPRTVTPSTASLSLTRFAPTVTVATPRRWRPGQMVTLHSTQHGLDGAQSRIVGVAWSYLAGDGSRRATIRFGGDRLRLRSRGTGNNVTGASVQGEIG